MENFSKLFESAVGMVGRTGAADAKAHVSEELRTEFKAMVKKLGGKTVARQLLAEMNAGGPIEESDFDNTFFDDKYNDMKPYLDDISKVMKNAGNKAYGKFQKAVKMMEDSFDLIGK